MIDDHAAADEDAGPGTGPDDVERLVEELDADCLRAVLADLARRDASVRRELETRRAAATGDPGRLADDLVAMVRDTTVVRGFIDYRRSFEVARDAQAMLDEFDRGAEVAPDAARPVLLEAVARLRRMVEQSDDSAGIIGDACQRAADLYARACRQGNPDRVELAEWLVRFRADSPGWPDLHLADFSPAFDYPALAAYRDAVATLDDRQRTSDDRFEVERMLLELADHDGDVDRAVALLARTAPPHYGAIVLRLRAAGRHDEVVSWTDRAVGTGRRSYRGAGEVRRRGR